MKWLARFWYKNIIIKDLIELFGDELNKSESRCTTPIVTTHEENCKYNHATAPIQNQYDDLAVERHPNSKYGSSNWFHCSPPVEEDVEEFLVILARPECPICFECFTLKSNVYQCAAGHLYCDVCRRKMPKQKCPQCRIPISQKGIRNRFLELMLQSHVGIIETQCDVISRSREG